MWGKKNNERNVFPQVKVSFICNIIKNKLIFKSTILALFIESDIYCIMHVCINLWSDYFYIIYFLNFYVGENCCKLSIFIIIIIIIFNRFFVTIIRKRRIHVRHDYLFFIALLLFFFKKKFIERLHQSYTRFLSSLSTMSTLVAKKKIYYISQKLI